MEAVFPVAQAVYLGPVVYRGPQSVNYLKINRFNLYVKAFLLTCFW